MVLLPEAEPLDQLVVPIPVLAAEVLQETAPAADELQQSAPRVVVLRVGLEMLGQVRDAVRQKGDLHLERTRVGVVRPILLDDVRLGGLELRDVHSASK